MELFVAIMVNGVLPVLVGFFAGMLWMRACYRDELRKAKRQNRRLERRLWEAGRV